MLPGRRRRRNFFDDFFTDMDEEFRQMEENMARIFEEAMKPPEKGSIVGKPYVYGFSMKVGPDGKPKIQEFGNVPQGRGMIQSGELNEGREPLTDVIDEKKEVTVIAELPGIEKKDIKLDSGEQSITISVDTPDRKYYKNLKLPSKVKPETSKATYKNGVLEVKIRKKEEKRKAEKGVNVKID